MPKHTFFTHFAKYKRFETREVRIGNITMGGKQPIVVQSMTTTDTMDTAATVAQCLSLANVGCQLIRITAPSIKEAYNLSEIKKQLLAQNCTVPLVADIHFTPNAAEVAARIVEKVRINPGNFVDKKKFEELEYTDVEYLIELNRIEEKFTPLVEICKANGTAMRIGTNHGSLSDRIMSRFGDTPLGMVESAFEFLRIAQKLNFHQIVLSMKASNPSVMIEAYRLLVATLKDNNMNYPIHLGVTEAGDGEDGRIKSAVGIGTLLEDGIGDTVRVSLTEDPEFEIPVAQALVARYIDRIEEPLGFDINYKVPDLTQKIAFKSNKVLNIGNDNVTRVIADFSTLPNVTIEHLASIGYHYIALTDKWNITDQAADYVYLGNQFNELNWPTTLGILLDFETWKSQKVTPNTIPVLTNNQQLLALPFSHPACLLWDISQTPFFDIELLNKYENIFIQLKSTHLYPYLGLRAACFWLRNAGLNVPISINLTYPDNVNIDTFKLYAATDIGGLLIDRLIDCVQLNTLALDALSSIKIANTTAFGILQACRTRISKTDYIACPSCGRTLFNLQETTALIRSKTEHLKGLKIGIMGCIVNGPGEMADADFGYVGSGVGKITLYKGKEVVKRNIPQNQALDELIQLIKDNNAWIEP